MKQKDPLGRSADEILANKPIGHSSWHFFQARSWLDLAKRTQNASALQYAAFELRYGLEYLLFELLFLTNPTLDENVYKRALKGAAEMRKMLENLGPNYTKLARFTELGLSVTPYGPKFHRWDLTEIFRSWGEASDYLHFVGPHLLTHQKTEWLQQAFVKLDQILEPIWTAVTQSTGVGILNPRQMEPEVLAVWQSYSTGSMSEDEVLVQLRKLGPVLFERYKQRVVAELKKAAE